MQTKHYCEYVDG